MADNLLTSPINGGYTIAADDISGVKYLRTKVTWGDDNTANDAGPSNPLPISQNAVIFRFSTNNSSVTQLAASATFTGVIETALDQPSISLLLTSDQPTLLTIRQFIDVAGTRAAPDISFTIAANAGFSRSFALNGNYIQVLAQNTGSSTTTTFNLNTAYGVVNDAGTDGVLPVNAAPPATAYFVNSLASTNGVSIASGTSGLSALFASNIGATAAFIKLYNKATAPTVGTDIPEMIIPIPGATAGIPGTAQLSGGFPGFRFPLGLGIAITGAVADTDTTAVAAGQVKVKLSRTV